MKEQLEQIKKELLEKINITQTKKDLEELQVEYLGRKGKLTKIFKSVKEVAEEERPVFGQLVNEVKTEIERVVNDVKNNLDSGSEKSDQDSRDPSARSAHSGQDKKTKIFDTTVPGEDQSIGTIHPITQIKNELNDAFKWLGFEIYEGPEITSDQYAFDNMNFPKNHPARESMDTYWVKSTKKQKNKKTSSLEASSPRDKFCLRPHLTGASVRYMQTHQPPFRFVYPGRVFRAEATDAGHERTFYQYEALIVNKDISFSGGKILVKTILERVFGREVKIRMRSGFFPFVEPGFEIDMQCLNCNPAKRDKNRAKRGNGSGCSVCGHSGWVEMMPGGVPHPNVLKAGGIDPQEWQGFYINIGLDRLVMMKYGIDDIRLFHSGDLRFLKQF